MADETRSIELQKEHDGELIDYSTDDTPFFLCYAL